MVVEGGEPAGLQIMDGVMCFGVLWVVESAWCRAVRVVL